MQDLPADATATGRLLGRLRAKEAVQMERTPRHGAMADFCYWNVQAAVQQEGGELLTGWKLDWVPGALAVATHHGVWRTPKGELVDVTPCWENGAGVTTFAVDTSHPIDLTGPVLIECHFIELVADPLLTAWVKHYREDLSTQRSMIKIAKRAGGSWEPGHGFALPEGSQIPPQIHSLHAAQQRNSAAWERVKQKVAAKYLAPKHVAPRSGTPRG